MDHREIELINVPYCKLSLTGARFFESITFEDWADVGKRIIRASECVQWLIGDWLNFGWRNYVETAGCNAPLLKVKYKTALETLPYEYNSLATFSWVAKQVEFSRRREKLTFSHHREVAGLEEVKQDRFLALAEKNKMSVADLRQLIRANESESDKGREKCARPDGMMTHLAPLSIWVKQQNPGDWTQKRRDAVKAELAPLVEFYNRL